ncbi:MAG: glycosyltransferase family 4 protein [Synechococcales bacterium]|nr:glycosyltransferase family 4 protein [Synechococcales bacterium]
MVAYPPPQSALDFAAAIAPDSPDPAVKISILVGDLSGGITVRAYLLAESLQKLGYRVEVIGFLFGKELYAQPPQSIAVTVIPATPYPGFLRCTRQLLKQIQGDILYALKPKPTSFGIALLKKGLSPRKVRSLVLDFDDWEMSWHGGDDWHYPVSLKKLYRDLFKPQGELRNPDHPLYLKWLERWIPKADAITIDTQFLRDRYGGSYVANGKDTELFNPDRYDADASRAKYGLSDYRVLMFPGAPRPHKGLETVLQALEQLNQPDLRLVIVGGSPYDNYDDVLMQQWGRWIVKLPRSPVEQMPEILMAAHGVVVTQRDTWTAQAQFPLKLSDGMAMGKPVLATRVGDIPEILGGTGYLVDPDSVDQTAAAIARIFANWEEAVIKGQQARQRCQTYYSLEAMAAQLQPVFAPLIPNPATHARDLIPPSPP